MLITLSEVMDLTGLSRATVDKKLKAADVPKETKPNSKLLRVDSLRALPAMFGIESMKTLEGERTRLASAQADKVEIELDLMKGTLLLADDVELEVNQMISAFRAKLLSLPVRAAPLVLPLADVAECELIIRDLVHEALQELSEYDPEKYRSKSNKTIGEHGSPATETDSKPVGRRKKKVVKRGKRRTRPVEH